MRFLIPANGPTVPNSKHWQFCVGSGHAQLALRTDYLRQLQWIHDELGIRYVRFHGIFCDDMHTLTDLKEMLPFPGAERFSERNFRACGIVYDNVLAAGMKPFVELGFMPRKLAADPDAKGFLYYKPNFSMPKDFSAWKEYLQAFIRFLLHRYGAEEVRSWYFEVWNEPDLGNSFFTGGTDGYLALYKASAEAIKAVDSMLKVGGPATSASRGVKPFRAYCEQNGIPLDFLSTHQYPGDPIAGVEASGGPEDDTAQAHTVELFTPDKLAAIGALLDAVPGKTFLSGMRALLADKSETTDIAPGVFKRNAAIVRKQAEGYPLIYSEWNANAIFSAYTNDTKKVAAYLVKTALEVAPYVDASSVWCFSDLFEEWHTFVEPFHGGFGLLNQDGIEKPGFWALKLLSLCGDERLVLPDAAFDGEIGLAAFRSQTGMQLLLFRQRMKSDPAAAKEATELAIELPAEPKNVTVRRIDDEHGNPLAIWETVYKRRNDLNAAEIEDIRTRSAVRPEPLSFVYADGKLTMSTALGVNDVCLIEITY